MQTLRCSQWGKLTFYESVGLGIDEATGCEYADSVEGLGHQCDGSWRIALCVAAQHATPTLNIDGLVDHHSEFGRQIEKAERLNSVERLRLLWIVLGIKQRKTW